MTEHNTFITIGASNHTDKERAQDDFYATEPKAVEGLLELEKFSKNVWECACGEGHISKVLEEHGYNVFNTDITDRMDNILLDFLTVQKSDVTGNFDIITNPPYSKALEFVTKAIELVGEGHKVAMLLRLNFLEGKVRGEFFKTFPPKLIYVARGCVTCAKNGEFNEISSSPIAYAWFIWEKGFKGEPIVRWFN